MNSVRGTLYTISAPSGAGKTTLVKALAGADKRVRVSVSHTTRPKRAGEIEGSDYHFVDAVEFDAMIADGAFLEYATVFGNCYGTSKSWVIEELQTGHDVILEIDWQGAQQAHQWLLQDHGVSGIGIFILPPSLAVLSQRLTDRGQDDAGVIASRMKAAVEEMSHYDQADFLLVNDDLNTALAELASIFHVQRLSLPSQKNKYHDLIAELLPEGGS
jgi:guanylate kinase